MVRNCRRFTLSAAHTLKLLLYVSLIACIFVPFGIASSGDRTAPLLFGMAAYFAKLALAAVLLAVFETTIAKMRVFRVPNFVGAALMLGLLGTLLLFLSATL